MGNCITDAVRRDLEVDICMITGGTFRRTTDIEVGKIILEDVLKTFPFGDTIVTLEVTGETLIEILENGLATRELKDGRFLQISGFKYKFDSAKPAGQRVVRDSITLRK